MDENKAALVTGGAIRLGYHFAVTLAKAGYDIAIHYNSSAEAAQEAAEEIRGMGRQCDIFQFDFTANQDPSDLIETVIEALPHLNVLINCASTYDAATTAETDLALLQKQFSVNFFTPYLLSAAFAKQVKAGNIINILDNKIAFQQYQYSSYLLSKKALADFTQLAAMEFAPNIRVNGIAPGVILPGETRTDEYIQWWEQHIPLKRQGKHEELGKALAYILDNEFITGQLLFVDGGEGLNHIGQNAEIYPLK